MAQIKGRCQPARHVIERLGGVTATARIVKVSQSAVSRWLVPPAEWGSGGRIPQRHWPAIMEFVDKHNIDLNLSDLLP